MKIRRERGFTLIELIVILLILGAMATIALPNFSNFVRKNRIQNQTKRIHADLINARVMSMSRNMNHFVVFDLPGKKYSIFADTNGNKEYDAPPGDTQVLVRSSVDKDNFSFFNVIPQNETIQTTTGFMGEFNTRGIAEQWGTVCIVASNIQPSQNCVAVSPTQIRIGKLTLGDVCNEDNCK